MTDEAGISGRNLTSDRKTHNVANLGHGATPIPLAASVGGLFRSSGISGKDPATGQLPSDPKLQVKNAFGNALRVLAEAGLTSDQVVYVDVFVDGAEMRPLVDYEWIGIFPDPGDRPARHTRIGELRNGVKIQLFIEAMGRAHRGLPSPTAAALAPSDPQAAQLQKLSTSTVSDALDRLRLGGQLLGIFPVADSSAIVGRAFTVQYEAIGSGGGGTVGDFIDDVPDGHIPVLDNHARADVTVWGDLLTSVASRRGLPGTVINGVCRDTDRISQLGYSVFSVGRWMRTGKDRVRMSAAQTTLSIHGVAVAPNDLVLGDSDGVLIVPAAEADAVIGVAQQIESAESTIRQRIEAGERLDVARSAAGYHSLQSPAER